MTKVYTKEIRKINPPLALLAELTHVCPLSCPYCSNPSELTKRKNELSAETWKRVFQEAYDLGVLQLHLSGGEPVSRRDIIEITSEAAKIGLYTNLITSGIGLTEAKIKELSFVGLDHIQLSLQGVNSQIADKVSNVRGSFKMKMNVVELIHKYAFPLTINAVMGRYNLDELKSTIELAEQLEARRLEVACVQLHGWAEKNRGLIIPTSEQVKSAKTLIDNERIRLKRKMVIDFVPPDWFSDLPKACMGGWGSTGLNVNPSGIVLPCHAAETIPGLTFSNVLDKPLDQIWYHDDAFNRFRGDDWMPELCKQCERKNIDFGGCRCQAMAILGDPSATDPVCKKSTGRKELDKLLYASVPEGEFSYRQNPSK